jgi:hypothetical protein
MLIAQLKSFFMVARIGSVTQAAVIARHEVPHHPDPRMLTFTDGAPTDGAPKLHEYLYCLRERRGARLIDAFVSLAAPAEPDAPA